MFSYEVRGINRVRNALRRLAALDRTILQPGLKEWSQLVRKQLKAKPYPSQRPGQTYVRTGNLANRWAAEPIGTSAVTITNTADHAGFVVGDNQAGVHAGRWWQASPVIEEQMPSLTKKLSQEIERVWESG